LSLQCKEPPDAHLPRDPDGVLNIVLGLLVIAGLLAAGAVIFYGGSYLVLYLVGVLFPLRRNRARVKRS
jgi:hypothetical protein